MCCHRACAYTCITARGSLHTSLSLYLSLPFLPSLSLSLSSGNRKHRTQEKEKLSRIGVHIYTHARVYNRYIVRACVSAKEASFSQDFSLLLLLPREREREDCEVGLGGEHLSPHLSRSAIIKFLQIVAHTRSGQGKYISSREENEFRIVCVHAWNIVYTGACHTW